MLFVRSLRAFRRALDRWRPRWTAVLVVASVAYAVGSNGAPSGQAAGIGLAFAASAALGWPWRTSESPLALLLFALAMWCAIQTLPLPHALFQAGAPVHASLLEHGHPNANEALTWSLSISPAATVRSACAFAALGCLALAIGSAARDVRSRRLLRLGFLCLFLILIGWRIAQQFGMAFTPAQRAFVARSALTVEPFGPFLNRNHGVSALYVGLFVAFPLLVSIRVRWRRWTLILAFTLALLCCLVVVDSKGAWLACVAALWVAVLTSPARRLRLTAGLLGVGTLAAAAVAIASFGPRRLFGVRWDFWVAALRAGASQPFGGWGAGGYEELVRFTTPRPAILVPHHAHGEWAQIFAELGLVGCALWAAIVVTVLWPMVQALRDANRRPVGVELRADAAALTALGVHTLVEFQLRLASLALIATIVAALAARRRPVARLSRFPWPPRYRFFSGAFVAWVAVAVAFIHAPMARYLPHSPYADRYVLGGQGAAACARRTRRTDPERAIACADRALFAEPFDHRAAVDRAVALRFHVSASHGQRGLALANRLAPYEGLPFWYQGYWALEGGDLSAAQYAFARYVAYTWPPQRPRQVAGLWALPQAQRWLPEALTSLPEAARGGVELMVYEGRQGAMDALRSAPVLSRDEQWVWELAAMYDDEAWVRDRISSLDAPTRALWTWILHTREARGPSRPAPAEIPALRGTEERLVMTHLIRAGQSDRFRHYQRSQEPPRATDPLLEAELAMAAGEPARAARLLRARLELDPGDVHLQHLAIEARWAATMGLDLEALQGARLPGYRRPTALHAYCHCEARIAWLRRKARDAAPPRAFDWGRPAER